MLRGVSIPLGSVLSINAGTRNDTKYGFFCWFHSYSVGAAVVQVPKSPTAATRYRKKIGHLFECSDIVDTSGYARQFRHKAGESLKNSLSG